MGDRSGLQVDRDSQTSGGGSSEHPSREFWTLDAGRRAAMTKPPCLASSGTLCKTRSPVFGTPMVGASLDTMQRSLAFLGN